MLPPALGDFTGQDMELAEITAWLSKERSPDEATPVVAVSGRGGVGKSTLAITAAHRLRPDYPDGQLYAVLGGARPHDPYAVLGRFLRALGVPAAALPDDADQRCGLYRSLLADRRAPAGRPALPRPRGPGQLRAQLRTRTVPRSP
ncbi:hypothetical protein ACGFJC_00235 [Nonomuraea fuscirosea]|uniref:hypothetical protein n=1 Tax=Nonomuraea fuscirosea TaxID=1291556 RepID=UPI00346DF7DE